MTLDTHHFKSILTREMHTLEIELATVGRKNPDQAGDWEATEPSDDRDLSDETEVADGIEKLDNNTAILTTLESRLAEVKTALEKIENGTYGTCTICGEVIETDRLEANPAATTCKAHMNS